ncbi:MAG TPA: PD-(D/E)XK nuclease family protein [Candidatus Dormibacteraeota bacterium]
MRTPTAVRVRPGPAATVWLRERIRSAQGDDPLAAVTVVVPTHHAGLHLRHSLAATGYAGVRFTVLSRLAEMLGARRLGDSGHMPLTAPVRGALVRSALRSAGGPLAASAAHAGLVDLVSALAAELRHRREPDADVARIRASGTPTARAALDAVDAYRVRLAAERRYDDVDLLSAAAAAVGAGEAASVLRDVGTIIVLLPDHLDPPIASLLRALAGHVPVEVALADVDDAIAGLDLLGLGAVPAVTPNRLEAAIPTSVTIAADAVEEVRAAVRDALAALERDTPVPLHRQAIVYRDAAAYGLLLRDTLTLAGLPYSSLDGRPLADTVPARALLGVVRLRDEDFSRGSVLGWLSGLPHRGGVLRSQARWDQLSRQAGVVRGLEQWVGRMGRLAEERRRALAHLERDDSDEHLGRRLAVQRDIDDASRIVEHVQAIAQITRPPSERTWPAHVAWLHRIRDEILTPDHAWGDADLEASQLVGEIVDGLGAAADIEPEVDVRTVLRSLEDALRTRARPEGRIGGGILIGPHRDLLGLDLERVHVLGALEGAFPAGLRVDPLLAGDPLDRRPEHEAGERRAWQVALQSSAGEVVVSAPTVDVDGRTVYPSPWLLELIAVDGQRPRADAVRRGSVTDGRLRRAGALTTDDHASPPLSVAERREREALLAHAGGLDITAIALARRSDLPLGQAVRVARARRSSELTEFDGDLAAAAPVSPLLAGGLAARGQSATGVQQWATCPFRFLLGRILSVAATPDADDERWWQIDSAERGTLIHGILEDFFREVAAGGDPPPGRSYTADHLARLGEIAEVRFRDAEKRGVTGHDLVWANERATILRDLRSLLAVDAERRGEGGWVPELLEQPFGIDRDQTSWHALEVPIAGGSVIRFRGFIDRVDLAPGRARVLDYKTGKYEKLAVGVEDRLDHGRRLQLAIYALAVRQQAVRDGRPPPELSSLYWYATSRGEFRTTGLEVTAEVEATLVDVLGSIDAGVRAGCFPQVPGDFNDHWGRCDNCSFCEFDAVCPAGRDVVTAAKRGSPPMQPYHALTPAAAAADVPDAEDPDG